MKKIIGLIILLLSGLTIKAQLVVRGNVKAASGEVLPFVNITMFHANDTTKIVTGGVTDTQGNYIISSIIADKYNFVISAIGYRTIKKAIQISKGALLHDFVMEEDNVALGEVLVQATRKNVYVDKSVYTFSKEQIEKARYSKDLLTEIEDLSLDMTTDKISRLGGGNVQILINGINATDNDLKSIPADKVLKVEYYDIPPARFNSAQTLVNIITKKLDSGWNGGIDARHAFTTGFGNDNLYLNYISGEHLFSFDYSLQYRNYKERLITEVYNYQIGTDKFNYIYEDKDKFGYTNNNINFKYTHNRTGGHILQVILSPNFSSDFAKGDGDKNILLNSEERYGKRFHDNTVQSFGPTIDVYFSTQLKNKQELAINLVGTYHHNKQKKNNREIEMPDYNVSLDDSMNQNNKKKSLIGELAYTKSWEKHKFSLGCRIQLASSNLVISNFLSNNNPYKYKSENNVHYFYAEYGNNAKRIMYRLGLGGTYVDTRNDDVEYSKILFTPKFLLTYKFNDRHNLQWSVESEPTIPSISYLNDNAVLITNELIRRGNPYLKSSNNYRTSIKYALNASWINLNLTAMGSCTKNPINTYYEESVVNGHNYIVSTVENANSFIQWGGNYSLTLLPFKNRLLQVQLSGMVINQQIDSPIIGYFSHWYVPFFYNLNVRKGNWGASYYGSIVAKQLNGSYLSQDENKAHLQLFYQGNCWRITGGCLWLFTKSKYFKETLANNVLKHSQWTSINDNRSMFTVGFSWNFSTKADVSIKRKMQNEDKDKGIFY